MSQKEPWNPFYVLLIVVSFGFVLTALAYALVPVLEQKAVEAGNPPPKSPIRESLREDGWLWLLYEGGAIAVLALLSMGYDRLRRKPVDDVLPPPPTTSQPPAADG